MRVHLIAALVLLTVLAGLDASRPPDRQVSAALALAGLTVYQATLSKVYGAMGVTCRFAPTCSHYARVCLQQHGIIEGSRLALRRVLRCGPWTPLGTVDPPPAAVSGA
ncbi:MAG: membrane protein insertion efficiency factor YidD [Vicinamibacterales bacterium]|nr:membrane protein insertion efficiency factor YidD [Vicinamibacterales bacterium]